MELSQETIVYITNNLISTVLIVIGAVIVRMIFGITIRQFVKKLEDNDPSTKSDLEQRTHTLASLAKNAINILIFGITFVMIISEWGINIAPILTGAGIIGLAVGFGTQKLVADIVTGFFILLENQYNVGDKVSIAGQTGFVKEMKLRTTVLQTEDGTILVIPNSNISVISKINDKNNKLDKE